MAQTQRASLPQVEPRRFEEPQTSWTPRTAQVSPALARMHERLRATRAAGHAGLAVPSISAMPRSTARMDARSEAIDAMNGGVAIERSSEPASPHMAKTLERFVRLRGRSGRAYVFSRIEARHVSLYRNGVFATSVRGSERANVIGDVAPILSNALCDDLLYVHLLSETDGDRAAVMADLA